MKKTSISIFENLTFESSTMLMTVAARASSCESVTEIGFHDSYARHIIKAIPVDLKAYGNDILFIRSIALRARIFDMITSDFIESNPNAIIVNLGCGLCSRGLRMRDEFNDTKRFNWFDVDVPEVIRIRKKYIDTDFGKSIAMEINNLSWLNFIEIKSDSKLLLLMEGVASYLKQNEIESFLIELATMLRKAKIESELLLDYIHPDLVGSDNMRNKYGDSYINFNSGFANADAIIKLHPSFRLKRDYDVFSEVSNHHAKFNLTFQAQTHGQRPHTLSHFILKPSH